MITNSLQTTRRPVAGRGEGYRLHTARPMTTPGPLPARAHSRAVAERRVIQAIARALAEPCPGESAAIDLLRELAQAYGAVVGVLSRPVKKDLVPIHVWTAPGVDGETVPPPSGEGSGRFGRIIALPAWASDRRVLAAVELYHEGPAALPKPGPALNGDATAYLLGSLIERWEEQSSTSLTPRQRELLALASHGATTSQIAEALSLSPSTVNSHFENIRARLEVPDRTAAVARALRSGVIA